ncbi:MAG: hypothetical protein II525_05315, partial [Bacteroidales bacterium]|nr:hypothetical protein [Bacteroidales bacterium]
MKTSSLHFSFGEVFLRSAKSKQACIPLSLSENVLCWLKESLRQASKKELVHFFEREQTSPKVTEAKERAFRGGGKNPVHYARQLAERRNRRCGRKQSQACLGYAEPRGEKDAKHLNSQHRSAPLPCYGKRIFSVTPQVGEITTEYNANFYSNILPKYSFNAKELDEETGMYYYEARYYKPPVFTSRDAMMDQKPWLTPYHSCSNNPVGRVDPSGMLDDEAKADKFYQRAVKKYGRDRVGYVYNAGTSEKPDYQFCIYDKGKEKDKHWTSMGENGVTINAYRGNVISKRRDYRNYMHSQGNDIWTIKTSITVGAQAGKKIKKINFSANISSIDLASIEFGTEQKIKFNHVNEYGETTHRMGLSLGFYGCNYTKEPYHDAT